MKQLFRHILLFGFFFLTVIIIQGQPRYYKAPVKIPLFLSGNFGELRSGHFHSGIDIKTQGVEGEPVYPVANGFISRISVSPTGFGNAIYIDHPNGTTSVYGHLQSFRKDITDYVKNIQYQKKSFRVNVFVPPGKFEVKTTDIIAHTGNSGSSGGPHLHFEIRDTKSEEPVNPLKYGFAIADKIAPKLFSLLIEPISPTSHVNYSNKRKKYDLVLVEGEYRIKNNPVIPVFGNLGFAISANDYLNGSWNKCGIYTSELFIDDELYFSSSMDRFSFSETKYINSYIVYDEYILHKKRYQKMWIDPGNNLSIYRYATNNGTYTANDDQKHEVLIIVKDVYGNSSKLKFFIKSDFKKITPEKTKGIKQFYIEQKNQFKTKNMEFVLPEHALYTDINFEFQKNKSESNFLSEIYSIHKNTTPIHKSGLLRIKVTGLSKQFQQKILVVKIDNKTKQISSSGGTYKNGWVESQISTFGDFAVSLDTIAPKIIPLSINNSKTLSESNRIRFKITDDLSGIKSYEGFIDGKWVLFAYDAKNNLITHYFDSSRYELNKQHNFVLKVSDYKNNQSTYEARFWK